MNINNANKGTAVGGAELEPAQNNASAGGAAHPAPCHLEAVRFAGVQFSNSLVD